LGRRERESLYSQDLDYYQLVEISEWFYIVGILLLVVTLIFGVRVRGAKSWLGFAGLGIQPSEIVKICYILFFAKYLSNAPEKEKDTEVFLYSLGIVGIPLGLIMLCGLGTAIVDVTVFLYVLHR
jgi:rod shape determining protein RodA